MHPYQIAVYYFPNYHIDPRNELLHGPGWTEWELVRHAGPRFPGHRQPRVPVWGYEDESDPAVMAKKIDAAADHAVTQFLFDWYWYDDGPFLNRGLDEGFLNAANNDRLQFALMWANHDWTDIHPYKRNGPHTLLYPGPVTLQTFETLTDYVIRHYFSHPSYWKLDGCPYFSIYELMTLIRGFGGIDAAREALDAFRAKTRQAGFPDLHLNAVQWGVKILPGETAVANPAEMLQALGFDSVTSYVWIHNVPFPTFPVTPYAYTARQAAAFWEKARTQYGLPYYPNVTMGWDSSPRTVQTDVFTDSGYPFTATLGDNTPQQFEDALRQVKGFLDRYPGQPKIFTINAWNEWTEGSYLEPDTEYGMGHLEAIRTVFGDQS